MLEIFTLSMTVLNKLRKVSKLFLKQMEIATVLLCISVHFQEQECIGCTMCTSIKFLHRCVTWEAHCFRGRRIASVKIKTSQVMLGKCMIYHYWGIMGMAKFRL